MKKIHNENLLNSAIVKLSNETYLGLIILIAPLLNFLTGINIDLYTPSLPAIAAYYGVSAMVVKNTITVNMLGFAVGCIIFGPMIDIIGRRRIILFGLAAYIVASFFALVSTHIQQLLLVRLVQGMMVSIASIGGRTIIMDNFTGHKLNIGLLYTSVAFGLGPIIAPFIGGVLQYSFGWKANFFAYAAFASILFFIFVLYVNESLVCPQTFSLKKTYSNYLAVIKNLPFMTGIFILGMCQIGLMIYPTVGAFLVENILHRSPMVYGNSALLVSCGYLAGTLTNRLFIKKWHLHHLTSFGFLLMFSGLFLQIIFVFMRKLNLFTIILPLIMIGFGNAFVFVNTLNRCLKLFRLNVGIAIGLLSCLIMTIGAVGVFIISHVNVYSLTELAAIFVVTIVLQLLVFFIFFSPQMKIAELKSLES